MTNVRTLLANPALLSGLLRTAMILVVSFGFTISQPQQDAVLAFVEVLILVVGSLALTGVTLARTTPVASPVLPEGTVVEVVTPEGQPNKAVIV